MLQKFEFLCGTNNLFKVILLICIAISLLSILYSSVSYFDMISAEEVPLASLKNKIAVLYANPTFHDEVVSANACMLHDMGYYVVVYIGNGVHVGDMLLPFSQRRKRNSQNFYGRCVSQWVTISNHMEFVPHIDILVFITYPMLVHGMKTDEHAMNMLRYYKGTTPEFPIVLVSHRSQEMLGLNGELMAIEKIFPRRRLTFLFLGEHTAQGAKQFLHSLVQGANGTSVSSSISSASSSQPNQHLSQHSLAKIIGSVDSFRIEHIYPVMPKDYVVSDSMQYYHFTSIFEHCWHIIWNLFTSHSTFSMGTSKDATTSSESLFGQNPTRSDIYHVYNKLSDHDICTNKSYAPFIGAEVNKADFVTFVRDHQFLTHYGGGMFSLQGNFGGKHAYRKDPLSVVYCLQRIENALLRASEARCGLQKGDGNNDKDKGEGKDAKIRRRMRRRSRHLTNTSEQSFQILFPSSNSNNSISRSHSNNNNNIKDNNKGVFNISLDLIGHLDGEIDIHENSLKTGAVRFLSDLDSKSYYTAISRTKFMVAGLKDRDYLTSRATSSIPAALIAQVPLVMTREYLAIYPCLRDQKIHQKIARETECEAVEVAFWLEMSEYEEAVSEIRHCSEVLWEESKRTFQRIIKPVSS